MLLHRRDLLSLLPIGLLRAQGPSQAYNSHEPLIIERMREGKPRAGQTVLAIQPHSDDIPIFAAGLFAKLIDEGATPYLIRVTNHYCPKRFENTGVRCS